MRLRRRNTLVVKRTRQLTKEELEEGQELEITEPRPRVRADCLEGGINEERPCPWVSCEHNNYLSVTEYGSITLNHPGVDPSDIKPEHSCALDVAERDEEPTLESIAEMMNLTRERVRQLEAAGLAKLKGKLKRAG